MDGRLLGHPDQLHCLEDQACEWVVGVVGQIDTAPAPLLGRLSMEWSGWIGR
jgi:hypothetical protein